MVQAPEGAPGRSSLHSIATGVTGRWRECRGYASGVTGSTGARGAPGFMPAPAPRDRRPIRLRPTSRRDEPPHRRRMVRAGRCVNEFLLGASGQGRGGAASCCPKELNEHASCSDRRGHRWSGRGLTEAPPHLQSSGTKPIGKVGIPQRRQRPPPGSQLDTAPEGLGEEEQVWKKPRLTRAQALQRMESSPVFAERGLLRNVE